MGLKSKISQQYIFLIIDDSSNDRIEINLTLNFSDKLHIFLFFAKRLS